MNTHRLSLDGVWAFQIDPGGGWDASALSAWGEVTVPMPWQAQCDDLRLVSGTGWYRRTFALEDAPAPDQAAFLHFGAVNYHATVWLNGVRVGAHEGGYLPFAFDVTESLRPGDNEVTVRVDAPDDDRQRFPHYPFSEVPHGKQSWYGPMGGIWQSVWLETRPRLHIGDLALRPDPAEGTIGVQVQLGGPLAAGMRLVCTAVDGEGAPVASLTLEGTLEGTLRLEQPPRLWSPETPHLYTVTVALEGADGVLHTASKTCGFRTVEARDGRIFLNGAPLYLRGVLDQGYFPETIYTPPSVELLEAQARAIKELGFNCLRIHIKVEDPAYYDVADRLGLLVWTEIPNWALLTARAAARAKETFLGMLARDGHHPSIIAWTLVNENWGTDLSRDATHRRWLSDFYHEAKQLDPTRLVVDNSACAGNAHVAGDLEDFHWYCAIPDHAAEWDAWVADFARRPAWSWYDDHAEHRDADLPLVVSEFGNWGLPDPGAIREQGGEPWWFETGHDWGEGIVYPHGVQQRYAACGLAALFPSYAEFAQASQEHMARSLHYEISTMRLHAAIAGYVVTECTDVHWECNGLLTMQRQPKHRLDPLLKEINQDHVVVLRPQRWSGHPGDGVEVLVQTLGVEGVAPQGGIVWEAGDVRGELPAPGGTITVPLGAPGMVTLAARWLAQDGSAVAANRVELACVETGHAPTPLRIVDDDALAAALRDLGHAVYVGLDARASAQEEIVDEIVVARRYTAALQEHVQQGGRLLLLAGSEAGGLPLPVGVVVPRKGTAWQGDWANSFAWMRKEGALGHLPGGPLLEMEWAALMPDAVLAGLPPWVLRHHSWAGLAVGWVHKAVSLLALLPYGRGQVAITTFKIDAHTLATDALARALFGGMVGLLGG